MDLVGNRRSLSHQRLTIVQQIEYLSALLAPRYDRRKVAAHQQIKDRLSIAKVVLVTRQRHSSDHPRITDLECHSIVKEQLFKPPQTPCGLHTDHSVRTTLAVERLQRRLVRMKKSFITDLSIHIITICNRL